MTQKNEMNRPLPRMSREKAQEWAHHFTQSMARSAKVEVSEKSIRPNFTECVGRNNEVPEDGRFVLDYYARAHLSNDKHIDAVKQIREDLKKNGYKIDGYREIKGSKQSVILDASSPEKGFSMSAEGHYKEPQILFSIHTPCLMPPGKKQKQY